MDTKAWNIGADLRDEVYEMFNVEYISERYALTRNAMVGCFTACGIVVVTFVIAVYATLTPHEGSTIFAELPTQFWSIAGLLMIGLAGLAGVLSGALLTAQKTMDNHIEDLRSALGFTDDEILDQWSVKGKSMRFALRLIVAEMNFDALRWDKSASRESVGDAYEEYYNRKADFERAYKMIEFLGLENLHKKYLFEQARQQLSIEEE